jgi:hypothetical protein
MVSFVADILTGVLCPFHSFIRLFSNVVGRYSSQWFPCVTPAPATPTADNSITSAAVERHTVVSFLLLAMMVALLTALLI